MFVIDASHNYDGEKLKNSTRFVGEVVSTFDVAPGKIRVGMVVYSNYSYRPFDVDDYSNEERLLKVIKRVCYYPGETNTPRALLHKI